MKSIKNRLRILLAQKETREGRSISLREVHRETGVPMSTVMGLASNAVKAISLESILALCVYLECGVGDLLYIEDAQDEADDDQGSHQSVLFAA